MDYIKQDDGRDGTWKFRKVLRHEGPLKSNDKRYKGSSYNLLVEWETGEWLWEPLHTKEKTGVFDTDPVTVGIYAYEKGLVGKKGWNFPYLKQLQRHKGESSEEPTRLSCNPSDISPSTCMVTLSHKITNKQWNWMLQMATQSGKIQNCWN